MVKYTVVFTSPLPMTYSVLNRPSVSSRINETVTDSPDSTTVVVTGESLTERLFQTSEFNNAVFTV